MVKIELRRGSIDILKYPGLMELANCIKDHNIKKKNADICIENANKELEPKGIKVELQEVGKKKEWSKDLAKRGVDYLIIIKNKLKNS